jgi:hypothetical protein
MGGLGCQVRSFNFGPDGLNSIEYMFILEQIKKSHPKKLSTIILDLSAVRYGFKQNDSDRTRFFNSWSNVPAFLYEIWNLPRFRKARALMFLKYFASFLYEHSAVGSLHSVLISPIELYPTPEVLIRQRGYNPPEESYIVSTKQDEQLTKEVADLKHNIDGWKGWYAEMNQTGHLARMRPVLEKAQGMGFRVGVVLAPAMTHYSYAGPLQEIFTQEMPDVPLWHYDDPDRWPEMFNGKYLSNKTHVNHQGATLFSGMLAKDLCPWFRAGELQTERSPG